MIHSTAHQCRGTWWESCSARRHITCTARAGAAGRLEKEGREGGARWAQFRSGFFCENGFGCGSRCLSEMCCRRCATPAAAACSRKPQAHRERPRLRRTTPLPRPVAQPHGVPRSPILTGRRNSPPPHTSCRRRSTAARPRCFQTIF